MEDQKLNKSNKLSFLKGHTLGIIITIFMVVCSSIAFSKTSKIHRIQEAVSTLSNDLTITIEERDAYNNTITLEKERGTLEIEDMRKLLTNLVALSDLGFSIVTDNGNKGMVLSFVSDNPYANYFINTSPSKLDENIITIESKIMYEDEFDAIGYENVTVEAIERLFRSIHLKDKTITAKQISDGVIKAKIRQINK